LKSHDAACARFGQLKSAGMAGRDEMFRVRDRAADRIAGLLGVTSERVAFLAHASEGLNLAVSAIDWRPGDNVVFADLEYPSAVYPAPRLKERGVEPRVVKSTNGYGSMDDLAAAVDGRTRLLLARPGAALSGP